MRLILRHVLARNIPFAVLRQVFGADPIAPFGKRGVEQFNESQPRCFFLFSPSHLSRGVIIAIPSAKVCPAQSVFH